MGKVVSALGKRHEENLRNVVGEPSIGHTHYAGVELHRGSSMEGDKPFYFVEVKSIANVSPTKVPSLDEAQQMILENTMKSQHRVLRKRIAFIVKNFLANSPKKVSAS